MNDNDIPEIRINYARLLQEDVSKKISKLNNWWLPSDEKSMERTEDYRRAWKPKEPQILILMQDCLGVAFYKKVIDVHIAANILPKSQPLIISMQDTPDQFIDTLTHELIHVLLTDNSKLSLQGANRDFQISNVWQNMFNSEQDLSTLSHIPVFAVFKKIMLDVHQDSSRIDRDKEMLKKFGSTSYLKSWDYVEKVGYEEIIEKLKNSYAEITKNKDQT